VGRVLGASEWQAEFSAVSNRVARDVQPFALGKKMQCLPNGMDVDFWRATPRSSTRSTDATRLISVMRLNAKKRPLVLVAMMRRLRGLVQERVELRIVGDGPLRSRVQRAIRRARLSADIELLGHQSRERIRELFAESDVFVLPTVRESFGLAALEARCAGLPVVAMRDSGVAEFVRHGAHGGLAASDRELADIVADLVNQPEKRATFAARSRLEVPPFDWTRVVEEHLLAYQRAIALRSPTSVNEPATVSTSGD
jgi:glycosyltransferase involved in cell wall biosynthesis